VQITQKATTAPLSQPILILASAARIPGRLSSAVLRAALRQGGVSTPRGYRREGFPDHELYQVLSGHKDRFDSL
jgi:hypothetical protein